MGFLVSSSIQQITYEIAAEANLVQGSQKLGKHGKPKKTQGILKNCQNLSKL